MFHLRPAQREDVDTLLELITELAEYENAQSSVKATPELLHQNLFITPHAHALLALSGTPDRPGEPIGFALYFFNFSTWTGRPGIYLEYLYVKPEHRKKGVGKAFFAELGRIAREKNCARLDWAVLTWNTNSLRFYEDLGAKRMDEWVGMRLEGDGIDALGNLVTLPAW